MLDAVRSDRAVHLMRELESRYVFLGLLGRGGSGLVFEVENRQLGRREALKLLGQVLGRHDIQRFAHEARMMAALDHPRILPIYAFGEADGAPWYSMKLVEGPTLARYLKVAPRPGPLEACQVAIPVLEALELSHSRGIIHRDIKPANILLDAAHGPILADFGIAKAESDPTMTETGLVLGTPAYVAPEQSLGQRVDGRSDLYALAISLYQLLAGRLPFEEGSTLAILMQRFQEAPLPLASLRPDLPGDLITLIARGMERQPEARFADAREMRQAFIQLAETTGLPWQLPLAIPAGLEAQRDPLPDTLLTPDHRNRTDTTTAPRRPSSADAATSPLPTEVLARLRSERGMSGRKVWLPVAALVAVGMGVAAWAFRRSGTPPAAGADPVSAPAPQVQAPPPQAQALPPTASKGLAESPSPRASRPAGTEPLLVRRAVTPPRLVDTPSVVLPPGSPCGGQPVSVELQVDEAGAVIRARLLTQVAPACVEPLLKAARGCRFTPALAADGQPVPATLAIALTP